MKRSRWTPATMLAALVLALSACAQGNQGATDGAPSPTARFTTQAQGKLSVGSDLPYKPFEYEEGGKFTGFDLDLVAAIAKKLGLEVEVKDSSFETIFTSLAAGNFDLVASAVTAYAAPGSPAEETVNERRRVVAFTIAYYDSLQSLAVDTRRTPNVKSTDDLRSGDRVGVQRGTTGQSWAQQNLKPKGIRLVDFVEAPQMFQALQGGQVKGVINDLPVSLEAVKNKGQLKVVQQIETGEQYAFAIHKDNRPLLDAVNAALRDLLEDGTYATLFKKYFPNQKLPQYASE